MKIPIDCSNGCGQVITREEVRITVNISCLVIIIVVIINLLKIYKISFGPNETLVLKNVSYAIF